MGLVETVNRAVFNLTYNEKASQAYDDQNKKAAGAVEDLKKLLQSYRDRREKIIAMKEDAPYFTSNSLARITEWDNWVEKNGGLAAGDYSKKETEMKTQWETILSSNKIAKELGRVPDFLRLYLKDKEGKIPNAQRKEVEALKSQAETYLSKMKTNTPADLVAKRDEFNRSFEEIQKKIPENFEDLQEPYTNAPTAPVTLLQGIDEQRFNTYKNQVEKKEKADENTFQVKRLFDRIQEYFSKGAQQVWPYVFGTIFAMIVANDAIGRPAPYRIFYFFFMFLMFQMSFIPGFSILVFLYYLYRAFTAVNWGNIFTFHPEGPRMDYMKAPVLFAFLPIFQGAAEEQVPWYFSIFKYDINRYGGLAKKKQLAYEINAAKQVGKTIDAKMFSMDEKTFEEYLNEMKSVLVGPRGTFSEVVESLKKLV